MVVKVELSSTTLPTSTFYIIFERVSIVGDSTVATDYVADSDIRRWTVELGTFLY